MALIFGVFLVLCIAAAMASRLPVAQSLGMRLSAGLILLSVIALGFWFWYEGYWPATTIPERWRMFLFALSGFLISILSFATAIRSLKNREFGFGTAVALIASFFSGAIWFVNMIDSIPVS